jgi:hypothetical protein
MISENAKLTMQDSFLSILSPNFDEFMIFYARNMRDITSLRLYSDPSVYILGYGTTMPTFNTLLSAENIIYKVGATGLDDDVQVDYKRGKENPPTKRSAPFNRIEKYLRKDGEFLSELCVGDVRDQDAIRRRAALLAMEQLMLYGVITHYGKVPIANKLESPGSRNNNDDSLSGQWRKQERERTTLEDFFS